MSRGQHVLQAIGHTPLFELQQIAKPFEHRNIKIFAKGEHLNPSGSVKDRAAKAMIQEGIRSGQLTKSKTIIDGTSGNTGIAYAMLGSALGYRVVLCLPANANRERKQMIRAYGAHIIESDPLLGSDGAQLLAKQMAEQEPKRYFYPDQYNNEANWRAHYNTTAMEIWEQSKQQITHFVAGMGTSGTFVGTARRLQVLQPAIEIIAMQPDSPLHGLEGMKHMSTTLQPGIYDAKLAEKTVEIDTDDALAMIIRLGREEGLHVGISAGANVTAAVRVAEQAPINSNIITVLCDSGMRYLSEELWKGDGIT